MARRKAPFNMANVEHLCPVDSLTPTKNIRRPIEISNLQPTNQWTKFEYKYKGSGAASEPVNNQELF